MSFISPLDLQTILVDKLAGNAEIFIFFSLFMLTILAARFKMPDIVFGIMITVFIILIGGATDLGSGSVLRGALLIVIIVISLGATKRFLEAFGR